MEPRSPLLAAGEGSPHRPPELTQGRGALHGQGLERGLGPLLQAKEDLDHVERREPQVLDQGEGVAIELSGVGLQEVANQEAEALLAIAGGPNLLEAGRRAGPLGSVDGFPFRCPPHPSPVALHRRLDLPTADLEELGPGEVRAWPDGEGADALVSHQPAVGLLDGFLPVGSRGEEKDGVDLLVAFVLQAQDHAVPNSGLLSEDLFDLRGMDVEALSRDDELLLAAEEEEAVPPVATGQIAGGQKPVPVGSGGLAALPSFTKIAGGDVGSPDQDLAVGGQADLLMGQGCADGPRAASPGSVDTDDGGGLGEAVALDQQAAGVLPQLFIGPG
jgi:hypothetical protein